MPFLLYDVAQSHVVVFPLPYMGSAHEGIRCIVVLIELDLGCRDIVGRATRKMKFLDL